jgi:ELWxxDGT repeat protein
MLVHRLSLVLLLVAPALAQGTPFLVGDLAPGLTTDFGGLPTGPERRGVTLGGFCYFAADNDGSGLELWRSGGTAGTTQLVKDLAVGSGSDPWPIGVAAGRVLFVADDLQHGWQPWATDGSAAGTQLLKVVPGGVDRDWVQFLGHWYFATGDSFGAQLWRTDGTPGGTVPMTTVFGSIQNLTADANRLWFTSYDGGAHSLCWWNGASVTTIPLPLDGIEEMAPAPGNALLFAYDDGVNGIELWRSDGSIAGTGMLVDIALGANGSDVRNITAWNGAVYFTADDGSGLQPIWRSDGTAGGTTALQIPGTGPYGVESITPGGSRIYFVGGNPATGRELWQSNGTVGGTSLVADIHPADSNPNGLVFDGTWLWFAADDGTHGSELWRTNVTTTQRCSDVQFGGADSYPEVLGFVNSTCLFRAIHTTSGFAATHYELFESTGGFSSLVANIRPPSPVSSFPSDVAGLADGRFLFSATTPSTGREPWFGNAPWAGAFPLADTAPGIASGFQGATNAWSGFGSFAAIGRLWRTNGTPGGTAIVGSATFGYDAVPMGGRLFLDASTPATGRELYVANDPLSAPVLVKDLNPGPQGSILSWPTRVGNRLFFTAYDGASTSLWVSDGTAAGTVPIPGQSVPGTNGAYGLVACGRRLFFVSVAPGYFQRLFVTDGTAAGTQPVGVNYPFQLVASGDRLFFQGYGTPTGPELYVTDGTTTTLCRDIVPGAGDPGIYAITSFGVGVLFFANDGVHGYELWRSDGTPAGTQLVADIAPGIANGVPPNGSGYGGWIHAPDRSGRALFTAQDDVAGFEMWRTDGTLAGTTLHFDHEPGRSGSYPGKPTRAGEALLFSAYRSTVGRELFAMAVMAAVDRVGSPCANDLARAPLATANGAPTLGNAAFALRVNGEPLVAGVLGVGLPDDVSLSPCELRIANYATVPVTTDGAGNAQFTLSIPSTITLAGARLAAQWGLLQANGPLLGLAALSDSVDFVLQSN